MTTEGGGEQWEAGAEIEQLFEQVHEAMTGGAEFTEYEEIDVGRFAGSNMNRKPRGVLRVLA
eukprot:1098644-Prorocentrum_minimum.AAC.1